MAAFDVVVAQEGIEVALDLGWRDVPGLAPCDPEAFVEQCAFPSFSTHARGRPAGAVLNSSNVLN